MFWKGTLLAEPREKPAHSHHPLLYTSPLTDTNLYSFQPSRHLLDSFLSLSRSPPFFPLIPAFRRFTLFFPTPPHAKRQLLPPASSSPRPLLSPSAALSISFTSSALIAFLMHRRRGHCGEVQREVTRKSIPAEHMHVFMDFFFCLSSGAWIFFNHMCNRKD